MSKPPGSRSRELLIQHLDGKNPDSIGWHTFFGAHSPLSQWYSKTSFTVDGVEYKTAEHWMMAAKARLFDPDAVDAIVAAATPGDVKKRGRAVRNFNQSVWDEEAVGVVFEGNVAKFSQNPTEWCYLDATGHRILVEAARNDKIWGIGLEASHPDLKRPDRWPGRNLLGFTLMDVRDHLRLAAVR